MQCEGPTDTREATGELPGDRRGAAAGQSRVDHIQAAVRAGAMLAASASQEAEGSPIGRAESDRLLAEELRLLRRMLDTATSALSEDIAVLMRHEKALQTCDIAAAVLEILARVVAAPDRAAAIAGVEMHEVRTRLSGQPRA